MMALMEPQAMRTTGKIGARTLLCGLAAVLAIGWAGPAWSQNVQGLFGERTLGGATSGGGRARSLTGTGNEFQIQSGAGLQGNERFLSENRQAGEFVGADRSDAGQMVGRQAAGAGQAQRIDPLAGLEGLVNNANRRNNAMGRNNARRIEFRTRLSLGFTAPPINRQDLAQRIQTRLSLLPQIQWQQPLEVTLLERTAVLTGVVATEHQRDLAAQMAKLEPGVSSVRNELRVESATSDSPPAETPAPSAP